MLYGSPSNKKQTKHPPIFDDTKKSCLIAFITRDSWTRRLGWGAICIELGYPCHEDTVKAVVESLG